MLQRDLLRGNSVYMVGSCCVRLLHIIHVSAVKMPPGVAAVACLLRAACRHVNAQCSKLSQQNCQSCCVESQIINIKLKKSLKKVPSPPPKLSASGWRTGSNLEHWNAPVVFLFFYFAAGLSRRSRAACCVPCKRSLSLLHVLSSPIGLLTGHSH